MSASVMNQILLTRPSFVFLPSEGKKNFQNSYWVTDDGGIAVELTTDVIANEHFDWPITQDGWGLYLLRLSDTNHGEHFVGCGAAIATCNF